MSGEDAPPEPVAVPANELSPQALRGVIEAFVLREGTDYGRSEFSFEEKIAAVERQLERGEAHIFFDPATSSVSIVTSREAASAPRGEP